MTKDVLVSISGKHIDIMEDPTAGYETGDDSIEVVTPASYYCKNGKHYIIYDEILEGKAGTIRNKIRITGNETVEIMKSGAASSHMIFQKNQKNQTYYQTPYGQMLIGVNTKNMEVDVAEDRINVSLMEVDVAEDRINVSLDYELDVNHEPLADCRIRMGIMNKGTFPETGLPS